MDETPDSFMALLRENKTPSSTVLGPTLKAMLTEQFHRIFFAGDGDFWENRKPSVASFESEILETTLSRVIRTNVPAAPIPGNAFNMRDRGTDAFTFRTPPLSPSLVSGSFHTVLSGTVPYRSSCFTSWITLLGLLGTSTMLRVLQRLAGLRW